MYDCITYGWQGSHLPSPRALKLVAAEGFEPSLSSSQSYPFSQLGYAAMCSHRNSRVLGSNRNPAVCLFQGIISPINPSNASGFNPMLQGTTNTLSQVLYMDSRILLRNPPNHVGVPCCSLLEHSVYPCAHRLTNEAIAGRLIPVQSGSLNYEWHLS